MPKFDFKSDLTSKLTFIFNKSKRSAKRLHLSMENIVSDVFE